VDELNRRLAADNTPGLYHRVLREKCNIRSSLCQTHLYESPFAPGIDDRYHDLLKLHNLVTDPAEQKAAINDMLRRCPEAKTAEQLAAECLKHIRQKERA